MLLERSGAIISMFNKIYINKSRMMRLNKFLVQTVKLKRICTMYTDRFDVPLEVSWSGQFTISDENVWCLLLHTGVALPQMCHKHVSAW